MGQDVTEHEFAAEYVVEQVDLSLDADYLLQVCQNNRKAEYPSLGDFADAFVKLQNGDSAAMDAYVAACNAVKVKWPKP